MTKTTRAIGVWGEEQASLFLSKKSYSIVARNTNDRIGEIDIVAMRPDGVLAFIEVKTRQGTPDGSAERSVTPTKIRRIQQAADRWLERQEYEFDIERVVEVVCVYREKNGVVQFVHHRELLGD